MLPLPKGAVWQALLLLSVFLLTEAANSEGRVVCYYTNWSVYRPGTAKFDPQNINPYLCTHLIYAFGGFTKDNTLKPFDKYQDIEKGGYAKFTGLKSYNKNLKTLLAIGGWNEGSSRFSPLVASPERRKEFIKNILKFLRQNHFDGLDLDWEYPAYRDGGKPRDRDNYAQFVEELRSEFDRESSKTGRPRLLVTMAIPAGIEYIEKGYDIPKLNQYVDWFNILSYDYHSAYEPSANHHAPLYSLEEDSEYNYDAELNIDYTIKFYLKVGADREKLVLGIPTYGRSYTLINEDDTDIGAPADGPGEQGDATREKGYLAYYEICQNLRDDPDWNIVQPNPKVMGPYAYRGDQWVGYDDEAIVRRKAEFVVENGLGGIMFWSIDNDDFRGSCTGKPYPLIEAAKEALLERLGIGDNEVARPSRPKKPTRSRSRPGSSTRNRIADSEKVIPSTARKETTRRASSRQKPARTTAPRTTSTTATPSSLYIGGRTTPEPPTTPDPGADFKCEEEGFFPHPRDCKKYFWCLDSGPSNLGIVAHQFTCPSGLYFNTAADSCDFTRNVLCKKTPIPETSTTTVRTTTTTTTTTHSPRRITAATSRNSLRKTSTTSEPEYDDEEYDDDDIEEENVARIKDSEEDPKVIKELIELIKKVGGLEELEKQLLLQEDGSMVLKNSKSQQVSTTPSSISKSLYAKVLSRPNSLNSIRSRFNQKTSSTTISEVEENAENTSETEINSDSRYSSVIRNSRPSPQNAGIDKLPEFEGFLREKPKYVTITRTKPTAAIDDDDKVDDEEDEFDELDEKKIVHSVPVDEVTETSASRRQTTTSPSYTNIRRTRPTTSSPEKEEIVDEVVSEITTKSGYQAISRTRATTIAPEIEIDQSSTVGTTNRYKTIERWRTPISDSDDVINNEKDIIPAITVQNLDSQLHTTPKTTQKSDTTSRVYANIERRTTTAPVTTIAPSTIITETITPEPTTTQDTTPPKSTPSQYTTSSNPVSEDTDKPLDIILTQNEIHSDSALTSTSTASGLDTDGNMKVTDNHTDQISTNTDDSDKVNLTQSSIDVNSSKIHLTNSNIKPQSSLNITEHSLSDVHSELNVKTVTTDKLTQTIDIESTTQAIDVNTKEFLGTVSSPRPFGFPRRRTRPTQPQNSIVTTNIPDPVSSTSADRTATRKSRPQSRPNTRRPVLSVRRRITTTTSPTNDQTATTLLDSTLPAVSTVTTTGNTKYNRRTRPTSASSSNRRTVGVGDSVRRTTINHDDGIKTLSSSSKTTGTDVVKPTPKLVVRRKFGRPNNGNRRSTTTTPSSLDESEQTTESIRTTNPLFKRRNTFTTPAASTIPITTTPKSELTTLLPSVEQENTTTEGVDQEAGSSIQDSKFTNNRYNQIGENLDDELVDAITAISRAPIPVLSTTTIPNSRKTTLIVKDLTSGTVPVTRRSQFARRPQKTTTISTTVSPKVAGQLVRQRRPQKPEPFEKINSRQFAGRTYRPVIDYDYYDDEDVRVVGKTNSQVKVVLHGPGVIECLDQGNFPHPLSCRKFISCAKMETGGVVGWEYTCPKGLSYDPVGGICNWAAGLGCKE